MEKLKLFRKKHPRLLYRSFSVKRVPEKLYIAFDFLLEPDISFRPRLEIPIKEDFDDNLIENFVFHLGLMEALSYWKAACPKKFVVKAGYLNNKQLLFWHQLFLNGLGEFFFKNGIDFTTSNFLQITVEVDKKKYVPLTLPNKLSGNLLLVDGGKDSVVTLELLKDEKRDSTILMLNPRQAAFQTVKIAGYSDLLVVRRTIDENLIKLNKDGYLNGHTPFSAYLAFLGMLIALLTKRKYIIVSNERSATEGNTFFHDRMINHQYSKSFSFERRFRDYCSQFLTSDIEYFSFLRPIYELQISRIFADFAVYHRSFRSCNVGRKKNIWCRSCAKCVFVFLSLYPFLSEEAVISIFGKNLLEDEALVPLINLLVGLDGYKPFECVGTKKESQLAFILSIKKYQKERKKIPPHLKEIIKNLPFSNKDIKILYREILTAWGNDHFLPNKYERLLKNSLEKIK